MVRNVSSLPVEKIMGYYLNLDVRLNKLYLSPFRIDTKPSCTFFMGKTGLLFYDFGTAKTYS